MRADASHPDPVPRYDETVRPSTGGVRRGRTAPVPDLTALLTLLAPHHRADLARQCDLKSSGENEDPDFQAREIAGILASKPDRAIRLRNEPKRPRKRAQSAFRFAQGERYLLGMFGSSIWETGVKKFGGQTRRQLSLRGDLPFLIEIDFSAGCALTNSLFGIRLIVEEDTHIPDGVTVITDLQSIRFNGRLSMGPGARLFGAHPCGLRIEADHLSGVGGVPGNPRMPQWPMVSTSIRPLDEQHLSLEIVNPDYPNLWIARGSVRVNGLGRALSAPTLPVLRGAKGADGACDWWRLGGHVDAEDGQSQTGVRGQAGQDGEAGEDGHSAAPPRVVVHSTYDGHVRFESSGGSGGRGGRGGNGQWLVSGAGGDVSGWCAGATKPGSAGAQGVGGDGGQGGQHGASGSAERGRDGRWLNLFTGEPEPGPGVPADAVSGAAPAEPSSRGQDGWNGSIHINGEPKVTTNQNNNPASFRYPVGTITAGAENDCWA